MRATAPDALWRGPFVTARRRLGPQPVDEAFLPVPDLVEVLDAGKAALATPGAVLAARAQNERCSGSEA